MKSMAHFQGENYPERLKHCIDGPLLLFTSGQINLKNRRIISVGTRQITSYRVLPEIDRGFGAFGSCD
jgi:DNA processing protein